MRNEVIENQKLYNPPIENVLDRMNEYLDDKKWNTLFGDVVPQVLANATNSMLRIIDVDENNYAKIILIKPKTTENKTPETELFLHRKNNHYSATKKVNKRS